MQLPLQITFRHMEASEAIEANIREKATKLDQYCDHIMSCRAVVEPAHRHHQQGNLFEVRLDITVPGDEIVVTRAPAAHHAHEDAYVAIRDAFDAARRQLEDYVRRRQKHVKTHEVPAHGTISELHPEADYGKIASSDGRDIYFHRNSVLNADFDKLELGTEVRFDEEPGEQGPKATTVRTIGKHHIVG